MHKDWFAVAAKECVLAEVCADQLPLGQGLSSLDHNLWLGPAQHEFEIMQCKVH